MKTNQLLFATMLASATGFPIQSLAEDKSMVQLMPQTEIQLPVEGGFPSLAGATE